MFCLKCENVDYGEKSRKLINLNFDHCELIIELDFGKKSMCFNFSQTIYFDFDYNQKSINVNFG